MKSGLGYDMVRLEFLKGDPHGPPFCVEAQRVYKKADPFYNSAPWRKVAVLRRQMDDHRCFYCMEKWRDGAGVKPRPAELVHHVIPRSERPDLALDLDNLRSACNICHNQLHPEKGRGTPKPKKPRRDVRIIKMT